MKMSRARQGKAGRLGRLRAPGLSGDVAGKLTIGVGHLLTHSELSSGKDLDHRERRCPMPPALPRIRF